LTARPFRVANEECAMNLAPWLNSLGNFFSTSKRDIKDIVREEVRHVLEVTVQITPPGSEGVKGKAAQKQGENAIMADLSTIYGRPSDAYNLVLGKMSLPMAQSYWWLLKNGETQRASDLLTGLGGQPLQPFDGGALHRRQKIGRRSSDKRKQPFFYVSNTDELDAYIKELKSRVGTLADGWEPALKAVGGRVAQWMARNHASGYLDIKAAGDLIQFIAVNSVRYASDQRGFERRLQWALDTRSDVLDRRVNSYVEKQLFALLGGRR
jgi:hypothetical protein